MNEFVVYYSYLWAEAYSHDLFTKFSSSPHGCFDHNEGLRYRRYILEPGANVDAINMLRRFLGRDPNTTAFLKVIQAV